MATAAPNLLLGEKLNEVEEVMVDMISYPLLTAIMWILIILTLAGTNILNRQCHQIIQFLFFGRLETK
jgi:hypothetical protein